MSSSESKFLLDNPLLKSFQLRIFLILFACLVLEGIDIQMMGIAAPAIAVDWALKKGSLGVVMAAALLGMIVGASVGGRLGDRVGRRPIVIGGVAIFALLTILIAAAQNPNQIAILRLLCGIGFGAVLTNAPALAAEWMPQQRRRQVVALVVIGIPIGGMIGAAAASMIIPAVGWRSAFVAAGLVPLAVMLSVMLWVPESLEYLRAHPSRVVGLSKILRVLSVLGIGSDKLQDHMTPARQNGASSADSIFSKDYLRNTIGLNIAFFSNLAINYAFFSWLPTLLVSIGFSGPSAIRGLFLFNLFGTLATLGASWLFLRLGTRLVVLWLAFFGAALMFWLAVAGRGLPASAATVELMTEIALVGIATVAGQASLYALAAHIYAPSCRATGLGFAGGTGRAGGLMMSFLGGTILAYPVTGATHFFAVVALLFLMVILGTLLVNMRARPEPTAMRTY